MLDASAIEAIVELGQGEVLDFNGHDYHVSPRGAALLPVPTVETIKLFSLEQVVNYIKTHTLNESEKIIVNVLGPDQVNVVDDKLNEALKVDNYAVASIHAIHSPFSSGKPQHQDDFIVSLMTQFVETEERNQLISLVSKVSGGVKTESTDDGYAQTVNVKSGVALIQEKQIKNLWLLKTFATFPEIEQPSIPYVLRVEGKGDSNPYFRLIDCDGGKWRVATSLAIRKYLQEKLAAQLGERAQFVSVL